MHLPMPKFVLLLLLSGLSISQAAGQGSREDYERSENFRQRMSGKVSRSTVEPRWLPGGERFWYRVDLGQDEREFVLVDAVAGTRSAAFDHDAVAAKLTESLGSPFEAKQLPIERLAFGDSFVELQANGNWYRWTPATASLETIESPTGAAADEPPPRGERGGRRRRGERPPGQGNERRSPDGRWETFLKDGNVWLRDVMSGEERAWTSDATDDDHYDERVVWAPDSLRAVARRVRRVPTRQIPLIESTPADQLQPKLHMMDYAKPGDELDRPRPVLLLVDGATAIVPEATLFDNPWSIDSIHWTADSQRFLFQYNQRGHQVLRIVAVDGRTGETATLFEETSPTFIDYAHKHLLRYLDETNEILWMSERDGWNHLYRFDMRTGEPLGQITRGEWVVRRVLSVDVEQRTITFEAGGLFPEQDPYYLHVARIGFDGQGLTILTRGNGTHEATFSPDGRFLIDRWSRVDQPPVHELRSAETGELIVALETADWSRLLAEGWQIPERFVAKGRDGVTDIHGVIYRPTNFDPNRKWPIIESIYAGPQGQFVPKEFGIAHYGQELTELGFVVVQMDGMGTNWRSKAFHDVCARNLGDSGFPDRIAWIRAAAAKYDCFDLTRVGIYGGSAGGQSALRALLAHGDFYHVAVADCGCHDNRIDKIWWNELWMGWPIGPHYEEQANSTQAHRLRGKLLLVVGEMDRNVDPASTLQVVDALIKADKDFDLLLVPGGGHGIAESPYGQRRRRDFFVRHLLQVEPRH